MPFLKKRERIKFQEEQPGKALRNIVQFSEEELCEIYNRVNVWQWDKRLGEMPEGFEKLPTYNRKWYHKLFQRRSKEKYITPICRAIRILVGEKELLRYHHLHNLRSTNEEFEKFWNAQKIQKATGIILNPFEVPDNVSGDNSGNNAQNKP